MRSRFRHQVIYRSWLHLFLTLLVVAIPFLYQLAFSQIAHLTRGELFGNLGISFVRLLSAYIIATLLAWVLAAFFYQGKRSLIALPVFDVMQSFPTFATLPLVMLLFGPSDFTIILLLITTVIWPILFSILSSLKLIKRDWEDAAQIYGVSGFNYLRLIIWPASIPGLITGSIIGLGEGWEALIATEIITQNPIGLGSFFQTHSGSPAITGFGILGFLIMIFSINKLIWFPLLNWSHHQMDE